MCRRLAWGGARSEEQWEAEKNEYEARDVKTMERQLKK